ncbi:hypothetical protein C8R42DRAFT_707652 [Lentinula raphanica]|nr:hypothetical protein C8R42DRAFT_707652 [Lentinula raphanica]
MRPQLPNEILYYIAEYIAYTPILPDWPGSSIKSTSLFQRPSPELLALSVVDWRLRELCLPILFAKIEIEDQGHVERLKTHLALFSKFIKVLYINSYSALHGIRDEIPRLKQLFHVELRTCHVEPDLLTTVLAHPTVTSVLVHDLPDESMCEVDLSKVILSSRIGWEFCPTFQKYLNQGMRLRHLQVLLKPDSLDKQISCKGFPGLTEITIRIDTTGPFIFSWLPVLSSSHPTLNEIWLSDNYSHFVNHTPPFLASFIEKYHQRNLRNSYAIQHVGLCRAGQSSQEWHVMGLALRATLGTTSLIKMLKLIISSFPKLESLALNLDGHLVKYKINEIASQLIQLSSLRAVYLEGFYERLFFKSRDKKRMSLTQGVQDTDTLEGRVEHGLLLMASHLAKRVKTLDFIWIFDAGRISYYESDSIHSSYWRLIGWLHVLNSNRDVGGKLR